MANKFDNMSPYAQGNVVGVYPIGPPGALPPTANKPQIIEASATNTRVGPAAAGTYIGQIILLPLSTSPGAVTMKDGSGGTSVTIFPGGAGSVPFLTPIPLPLAFLYGADATGVFITTGANLRLFVYGNWTA